jgi:uncharacterized protein (TIGR03067 family)
LVVRNTTIEFACGKYHVHFGGVTTDTGTFEFGGNPKEKTMQFQGVEGPNSGRTIPCLYQLAGDRLLVCYGLDGVAPKEFPNVCLGAKYLATYHRVLSPL